MTIAAAAIPALINAAATMYTSYQQAESKYQQEKAGTNTKFQKQRENLMNDLLKSVQGVGPYSDLFNMDEEAFKKSYVEPAKSRFSNQIAPQIQQSYIGTGQQRNSGLNDQLLRAGVDMDQMLNEQYMNYVRDAQNRKANAITGMLNTQDPNPQAIKPNSAMDAISSYVSSPNFGESVDKIMSAYSKQQPTRKGFVPDWASQGAWGSQSIAARQGTR